MPPGKGDGMEISVKKNNWYIGMIIFVVVLTVLFISFVRLFVISSDGSSRTLTVSALNSAQAMNQPGSIFLSTGEVVYGEGVVNTDLDFSLALSLGAIMGYVDASKQGVINESIMGMASSYIWGCNRDNFKEEALFHPGNRRGGDVVLTIDSKIQIALLNALNKYPSAQGVVLNWKTGEVIADVSLPSISIDSIDDIENYTLDSNGYIIRESDDYKTANKTLIKPIYPGSSIKPLIAAAVLEKNPSAINTTIECTEGYQTFSKVVVPVKCAEERAHGTVSLVNGLALSCNKYIEVLGRQIELEELRSGMKAFGIGQSLNFSNIYMMESTLLGNREDLGDKIVNVDFMGSGDCKVTLLQLAIDYSAFANNGQIMQPTFIKQATNSPYDKVVNLTGQVYGQIMSSEVANTIKDALRQTVVGGTATELNTLPVELFAKTGTAEIGDGTNNLLCVAGGMGEDFPYIIAIAVEQAEYENSIPAQDAMMEVVNALCAN